MLNTLSFRNKGNLNITGCVKINGQILNSFAALSDISGYIQQESLFISTLRVNEQLKFQVNSIEWIELSILNNYVYV